MSTTNMDAAISTIVCTARTNDGRLVRNASEVQKSDYCVKVVAGERTVGVYAFRGAVAAWKFSYDVAESCPNVNVTFYRPGAQFDF